MGAGPATGPRLLAVRGPAVRRAAVRRHPLPGPGRHLWRRAETDQAVQDPCFPVAPLDGGFVSTGQSRIIDTWFPCAAVDDACGSPVGSGKNEKAIFTWFAS